MLEISFNMEKNEHDLMFRNPINNKWLMRYGDYRWKSLLCIKKLILGIDF